MVPFRGRESIFCSLRIRGKALQLLYRNLQIHPINPDQPVHILEISIHLPEPEFANIKHHSVWASGR